MNLGKDALLVLHRVITCIYTIGCMCIGGVLAIVGFFHITTLILYNEVGTS